MLVVVAWMAPIVTKMIQQTVERSSVPLDTNDEYDELGDEDGSSRRSLHATTLALPA